MEKKRFDKPPVRTAVGEAGALGGEESPMALDLAALYARPPKAFMPLNILPPTLIAALPMSFWVIPPIDMPDTFERGSLTACPWEGESDGGSGEAYARNLPDKAYVECSWCCVVVAS